MANEFVIKNGLQVQSGGIKLQEGDFSITGSLTVSGSNTLKNIGPAQFTGSVDIYKSGSTVFSVEGSQGTLFQITDNLSGSLFAVSDISGVPTFEIFSDDTIKLGTFGNEAIVVSGDTANISGSFTGSIKLNSVVNAGTDTDKFLVLDAAGNVDYRTGTQILSDIGASLDSITNLGSSTTNSITVSNFTLSNPTNNNAGSDKILVLDGSNRSKIRTRDELRSDIGALQASKTPQLLVTAAEVLDEATTDVYIPFAGINIFPESNEVAYSRFHAPYDGYIKEIIVHPHSTATSGNCTITPTIAGTGATAVQASISGTAGTPTTFSFGSSGYSFSDGDDIVLAFDRQANDRSRGFSFTIVFIMDATS